MLRLPAGQSCRAGNEQELLDSTFNIQTWECGRKLSTVCASLQTFWKKKRQSMWSIRAVEQERPDQYELPERTPHACNEYFCISWQRRGGQVQPEWWSLGASCFYFPRRGFRFSLSQPAERKEPPSSALKWRLRMKRLVWSPPQLLRFYISVFTMSVVITLKLCLRFLGTVTMNCFNVGLHHILDVSVITCTQTQNNDWSDKIFTFAGLWVTTRLS